MYPSPTFLIPSASASAISAATMSACSVLAPTFKSAVRQTDSISDKLITGMGRTPRIVISAR